MGSSKPGSKTQQHSSAKKKSKRYDPSQPLPPHLLRSALANDHKKSDDFRKSMGKEKKVEEEEDSNRPLLFIVTAVLVVVGFVFVFKGGNSTKDQKANLSLRATGQGQGKSSREVILNEKFQKNLYSQRVLKHKLAVERKMRMAQAESEIWGHYEAPPVEEELLDKRPSLAENYYDSPQLGQVENAALSDVSHSQIASGIDPQDVILDGLRTKQEIAYMDELMKQEYVDQFKANALANGWVVEAEIVDNQLQVYSVKRAKYRPGSRGATSSGGQSAGLPGSSLQAQ